MARCECCQTKTRRPFGFFSLLFNLLLVYLVLVVGGGTLINTGHPVAVEVGQLFHLVTFVDPTITWADGQGHEPLATTVRFLSNGVPIA